MNALTGNALAPESDQQQQPRRLRTLALHYSFKEDALTPISAAAARAIATTLDALRFQDARNPELDAIDAEIDLDPQSTI